MPWNKQPHSDIATLFTLVDRGLVLTCLVTWAGSSLRACETLFQRCDVWYSIPESLVVAVQPFRHYTPLPFSRSSLVGLVKVDTRNVVALDVHALTGSDPCPPASPSMLVIVSLNDMEVGLLADQFEVCHTRTSVQAACASLHPQPV